LRYDFDYGSLELMTLFNSFIYFSTTFKSEELAILLVVITTLLLSEQIWLAEILNFIPFSNLLIFAICIFYYTMTLFTLFVSMSIIIYFFDELLVVILSLDFSFWLELFMTLWISEILLGDSFGKVSLILMILLMLLLEV